MLTRIIGDVHGKFNQYKLLLESTKGPSIQVGDFGLGFGKDYEVSDLPSQHRFIRGNHDSPEVCYNHPNWIPDGIVEGKTMFIGGAWSIDHALRTEGVSWWRDEELSIDHLNLLHDKYLEVKPDVMVTHDAPWSISSQLLGLYAEPTRTGQALEAMFYVHQPKRWFFGHYHKTWDLYKDGTEFLCLGELDYLDVQL